MTRRLSTPRRVKPANGEMSEMLLPSRLRNIRFVKLDRDDISEMLVAAKKKPYQVRQAGQR